MKNPIPVLILILAVSIANVSLAQTVYKTKTGNKYHTASHYDSSIGITLAEARRLGLEPCKVCKPPKEESTGGDFEAAEATEASDLQAAPAQPTKPSSSTAARQCNGTTKAGARCKRNTTDPSGYCYQHK